MCGIVGIINKETVHLEKVTIKKIFQQMLTVDVIRGNHGTGILGVTDKGQINVHKKPINSFDFLELTRTKDIVNDDNIFLVGHNRYSTMGAHTIENSHPFTHNGLTLFHNGTLRSYHSLTKDTFKVDSEYACCALSETEDKISVLEKIEGAYSFVWYDEKDSTLNFARNDERPMYFAKSTKSNSHFFGSEGGMIKWIAERNGVKLEEIYSLKSGILLTIPLEGEATTRKFTVKEDVPYNYYQNYGNSYNRNTYNTNKTNNAVTIYKKPESTVQKANDKSFYKGFSSLSVNPTSIEALDNLKKKDAVYLKCSYKHDPDLTVKIYLKKEVANILFKRDSLDIKIDSVKDGVAYAHVLNDKHSKKKSNLVLLDKKCDMCDCDLFSHEYDSYFKEKDYILCQTCSIDWKIA